VRAYRIAALAKRVITQLRRDKRTIGLLVVVPLLVLSLTAVVMRSGNPPVSIGIVNAEKTPSEFGAPPALGIAARILHDFEASPDLKVQVLSADEADRMLRDGRLEAVVVLPANVTRQPVAGQPTVVDVMLEGSNPQASARAFALISRIATQSAALLASPATQAIPGGPVELRRSYIYGGQEYDTLDYFAPVFIALFAFFLVFLLTSVSFLRERAQGTMERLMASPLTRTEMVLGYMLGFSVFALAQVIIILLYALYVLNIHYRGSPFIVFVIVAILTIGAVNLGIFLSTFARNELQAVQFIPIVLVPQVLLGGVFWAVQDMPRYLQWIAYFLPLTYANDALRSVMIKGHSLTNSTVALDTAILVAFAALMVFLGALTLQKEMA